MINAHYYWLYSVGCPGGCLIFWEVEVDDQAVDLNIKTNIFIV